MRFEYKPRRKKKERPIRKCVCELCGAEFETKDEKAYYCEPCHQKMMKIRMKTKVDRALDLFKDRTKVADVALLEQYGDEIKAKIDSGEQTYGSTQEVAVAIQLMRNGTRFFPQYKVGNTHVDFLLPTQKAVLEVDGEVYHTDENASFLRDRKLMSYLGEDWEIVHIKAERVPLSTWHIDDAIPYILKRRKKAGMFRDSRNDEYFLSEFNLETSGGVDL